MIEKPEIKASISLPFVLVAGIGVITFLIKFPMIIVWTLMIVSSISLLGLIWYNLYVWFGGEVQ